MKTLFSFLSGLAAAIAIYIFFNEQIDATLGLEEDDIHIVSGYLDVNSGFYSGLNEVAFLTVEVRNLGNKPVQITSAKLEFENNKGTKLEIMGKTFGGTNTLGENILENIPVLIQPGKTKKISYAQGIKMTGILPFFTQPKFKKELCYKFNDKYIMAKQSLIIDLNNELKTKFGDQSALKITFLKNTGRFAKAHMFELSKGSSIFDTDGHLKHDLFFGSVINSADKSNCI